MSAIRRALALVSVLLSLVFFVACAAGIAGAWVVKKPLTERATRLFTRTEAILNETAENLQGARNVLKQAQQSLGTVQANSLKLGDDPKQNSPIVQSIVQQVASNLAPKVGDVRQTLGSVTEAAVVANTVLDNLNEIPLVSVSHLDTDQLQATSDQLTTLAAKAQQLSALLPEKNAKDASAAAVNGPAASMEDILRTLQSVADEYEPRVVELKDRVGEVRSHLVRWIDWGTIGLTLVLGWLALSQVSMLCHGWGWLRSS
jgi:hypothetical protein